MNKKINPFHQMSHDEIYLLGQKMEKIKEQYSATVIGKIARLPDTHRRFPGRHVRIKDWCMVDRNLKGEHFLTLSIIVQKLKGGDMYSRKAYFSEYGKDLIFEEIE